MSPASCGFAGGGSVPGGISPRDEREAPGSKTSQLKAQGRELALLEAPLLQQTQQHLEDEQKRKPTGGEAGPPPDAVAEGLARRVENVRAQCVEAFGVAVEREKAKVAAFFSEQRQTDLH